MRYLIMSPAEHAAACELEAGTADTLGDGFAIPGRVIDGPGAPAFLAGQVAIEASIREHPDYHLRAALLDDNDEIDLDPATLFAPA